MGVGGMEVGFMLSHFIPVQLFATPWTIAHQAPHSMGSGGKNTGVGCHVLLQGVFPAQESNLHLLCPCIGKFFTSSATWEAQIRSLGLTYTLYFI